MRISGFFLTALFVFYFAGVGFFNHTHLDEYNNLVVHSHPFSSESNHQHAAANFIAIDKLSNLTLGLIILGVFLLAVYELKCISYVIRNRNFIHKAFTPFCFSRPPPVI